MVAAPAPVKKAREFLKEKGVEIDTASIQTSPADMLHKIACNYRNSMTADVKKKYKVLKTNDERRQWLVHYLLDPKAAVCTGFNKTTASDEENSKKMEAWITEEQMGGPLYLNSATHAKTVCASKIFEEQDHDFEALAKDGVKQFRFNWSLLQRSTGIRKEAGVKAVAELSAQEYERVRDQIDTQRLEPQAKKQKMNIPNR